MLTSIDWKATFDLTASPKAFIIEDLTDYVSQGVAEADANGILTMVGPDGTTFYQNLLYTSPDIDVDVSRFNSTTINIPTLADGSVEPGTYTLTYSVQDDNDSTVVVDTKTFDFCYISPEVSVSLVADCIAPTLTSDDTTNYIVETITPTIVRTHTLRFPLSTGEADLVSTSKVIQTQNFFTETHQNLISSALTYDYGNGICIEDLVTGSNELDVQCDSQLCDLYCCLKSLYKRWQEARCVNSIEAEKLKERFVQAEAIRNLIKDALGCNVGDDVSGYVSKVLELGDCEPGCGCEDGEPSPVYGLSTGSTTAITVVDAGTGIVVTPNILGDTTTYTVEIDPAVMALINAATNVAVLAGSGISVNSAVVGGQTQYTVVNNQTQPGMISLKLLITFNDTAIPTLAKSSETIYGVNSFQASTFANLNTGASDWLSKGNAFRVDDILNTATDFTVTAQGNQVGKTGKEFDLISTINEELTVDIYKRLATGFEFRLVKPNGAVVTGRELANYKNITISTQIIE